MAGLDEETDVGVHEAAFHRDVFSVGEDGAPVSTTALDEAEDIVPSTKTRINSPISMRAHK